MASGRNAEVPAMDQLSIANHSARHLPEGCFGERNGGERTGSVQRLPCAVRLDYGVHNSLPPSAKGEVRVGNSRYHKRNKLRRNAVSVAFQLMQ